MDFPLIRVWSCAFGSFRRSRMSEPYYICSTFKLYWWKMQRFVIICVAYTSGSSKVADLAFVLLSVLDLDLL